ncbi:MAG: hypothetical protein KBA81_07880 [Rhabdochlamydiaceae bacterium]|nr:hypothetical protein [Rhabdochlamydiaceae bacterium]
MKITDLAPHYPPERIAEFESRKERIRSSGLPGSIRLLKDFDGAREKEGFLNRLCEVNIANRLMERGKRFEYETQGEDFAYDDILLSVKSLQPKAYEREEAQKLLALQTEAAKADTTQKDTFMYETKHSMSHVDFEVTQDGYSRSETGTLANALLKTDADEERVICRYTAEFELIPSPSRKKVMFFMRQSDRAGAFHVEDVARWYFGQPDLNNADPSFYEKAFKTKEEVLVEKAGSIKAFVFMWHTDPFLWSSDFGEVHVTVWSIDEGLTRELEEVFSDQSQPQPALH